MENTNASLYCPHCNRQNNDSAVYCKNCGSHLTRNHDDGWSFQQISVSDFIILLSVAGTFILFGINRIVMPEYFADWFTTAIGRGVQLAVWSLGSIFAYIIVFAVKSKMLRTISIALAVMLLAFKMISYIYMVSVYTNTF